MLNSFYDKFIFTNSLQYRHNNFFLVNLPFVMLPVDALAAIASKEDKEANCSIYYAVKASIIEDVKKNLQLDFGVGGEKALEFMQSYLIASGWGDIQRTDIDFENARCLVSVTNSPIAQACKQAKAPADTILRGFLAGIFSIYFSRKVECIEVKCASLGDAHCDFVVKPLEEFNFENPLTRGQLRVE